MCQSASGYDLVPLEGHTQAELESAWGPACGPTTNGDKDPTVWFKLQKVSDAPLCWAPVPCSSPSAFMGLVEYGPWGSPLVVLWARAVAFQQPPTP